MKRSLSGLIAAGCEIALRAARITVLLTAMPLWGCQEPVEASPGAGKGVAEQAYALRMTGHPHQARELLEEAARVNPRDAALQLELARACLHTALCHDDGMPSRERRRLTKARIDAAWEAANTAARLAPDDPLCHRWRGWAGVYAVVERAHSPVRWLGMPRQSRGMYEGFERALALDPEDGDELLAFLCGLYARMPRLLGGGMDKALAHLAVLEENGPVAYALGRAELGYRDIADGPGGERMSSGEVLALWQDAVCQDPGNALGQVRLGLAYLQVEGHGSTEYAGAAWEHLNRGIELSPELRYCLLDAAEAWLKGKCPEQARLAARAYFDAEPNSPGPMRAMALRAWSRAEEALGEAAEAAALRKLSIELDPCPEKPGGVPLQELCVPLRPALVR